MWLIGVTLLFFFCFHANRAYILHCFLIQSIEWFHMFCANDESKKKTITHYCTIYETILRVFELAAQINMWRFTLWLLLLNWNNCLFALSPYIIKWLNWHGIFIDIHLNQLSNHQLREYEREKKNLNMITWLKRDQGLAFNLRVPI